MGGPRVQSAHGGGLDKEARGQAGKFTAESPRILHLSLHGLLHKVSLRACIDHAPLLETALPLITLFYSICMLPLTVGCWQPHAMSLGISFKSRLATQEYASELQCSSVLRVNVSVQPKRSRKAAADKEEAKTVTVGAATKKAPATKKACPPFPTTWTMLSVEFLHACNGV